MSASRWGKEGFSPPGQCPAKSGLVTRNADAPTPTRADRWAPQIVDLIPSAPLGRTAGGGVIINLGAENEETEHTYTQAHAHATGLFLFRSLYHGTRR